jgi:hypothetical protein
MKNTIELLVIMFVSGLTILGKTLKFASEINENK